jgi:hypothetical protein
MYNCLCCSYSTDKKSNISRHMTSARHLRNKTEQNRNKMEQNGYKTEQNGYKMEQKNAICKYCNKAFTSEKSMRRHVTYTCKKNEDEDLKELVRLLNKQLDEQKKASEKQIECMQKQINQLSRKLQINKITTNNTNSHNNTQNNTYNIQLLNFQNTDYSHLKDKDYIRCINDVNHCVKTMVCKVHFDPKKPENHNIYISNIKNKYVMMYRNNHWDLVDRKQSIDDLYDYTQLALEEWYDEYKDKYPDIIKSFERYLKNINDDSGILKDVKELIIQLLYNKRHIVLETKGLLEIDENDDETENIITDYD